MHEFIIAVYYVAVGALLCFFGWWLRKCFVQEQSVVTDVSRLRAAMIWWRDKAQFRRGCIEEYEHESDWHASEITKLRAALAEALDSLDLATADCILMALASKRALAKFKDSDDEPCRWCGSEEDIHEEHCPSHVLVDIGFVGLIGDEVMRRSMEEFVEEEDRKRREARP
jgi:hypothetical protein